MLIVRVHIHILTVDTVCDTGTLGLTNVHAHQYLHQSRITLVVRKSESFTPF